MSKADCKVPMSRNDSRKAQLDMLDTLVEFCEKNNLRYSLSGGTLLGAIRHKGFIPWDDDIDVNMPRPDCERLMRLTNGKLGKYRLEGPDFGEYSNCCNWFRIYNDDTVVENYKGGVTKKNPYYHPMFIDVFPVEGLPNSKLRCYIHWWTIIFLEKMRRASVLKHMEANTIWRHLFHLISVIPARIVGYKNWGEAIQKCSKKYSFDNATYVGVTTVTHYITKERVLKKYFLKHIKVVFEGKEYDAPENYDTYLRQLYGDYMKMPPVEEQKSGHAYHMYWRTSQRSN